MALIEKGIICKEIERRTYNAHEMPNSRSDKQFYEGKDAAYGEILSFLDTLPEQDMGEVSDGYHTFNELYYYRMLYNAAFFNLLPKEWVHKSKRHHTGEECFGGGWFIVMANLPTGQISNHYELKDWDLFKVQEKEFADEWDGHTPQEAAERLHKYLTLQEPAKRSYKDCNGCEYNRTIKDQIGWQFRGCFGGDYKGKPIVEIELCPLKVATIPEQPVIKKSNALFDKCVENCDPAVMKEVSDNVDKMLRIQPVEGLEEEIAIWIPAHINGNADKDTMDAIKLWGENVARHFYELGCRRTAVMYDDIEYKRQIAEEDKLSGDLEEEIERVCAEIEEKNLQHRGLKPSGIAKIARHFAEFGRKQVLQEIYEGKVKSIDKITSAWLDDEQNI